MNSRERMRRFYQGLEIDRIPNGLGASETAGLHVLAYDKLKRILGINEGKVRMSTMMCTALFEPEVLEAIQGDMILLGSRQCPAPFWGSDSEEAWHTQKIWDKDIVVSKKWQFEKEPNGEYNWNNRLFCPPSSLYFDEKPEENINLLEEVVINPADFNPSHDLPDSYLRHLEESAKWLYNNTGYSIVCGETVSDLQLSPGGTMQWWMTLASEPEIAHEYLGKAVEASISQMKLVNQAVGKYADTILVADDMGDLRGVTIGAPLWREIYKPYYKQLYHSYHQFMDMKICLHSCGSIYEILGDLIECGIDIINPVQISAKNMQPKKLQDEFGEKVIFYGGAYDAVMMHGLNEEDVYNAVCENIKELSRNGRYIFAGVHNLPGDIPESHLKAILRAYKDVNNKGIKAY